jgi:hypothetical protein
MGDSAVLGTCRLCGAYGSLENSHIVSKAAYRRALQGPDGEAPERQLVMLRERPRS